MLRLPTFVLDKCGSFTRDKHVEFLQLRKYVTTAVMHHITISRVFDADTFSNNKRHRKVQSHSVSLIWHDNIWARALPAGNSAGNAGDHSSVHCIMRDNLRSSFLPFLDG